MTFQGLTAVKLILVEQRWVPTRKFVSDSVKQYAFSLTKYTYAYL